MLNQAAVSLDRVFHALTDPSRRSMIERLSLGPATVSELAEPLDMTLAAVMQHLRLLEESGMVQSEKVGRVRTCRLDAASLSSAERWIQDRRALWSTNLDRLGDFLEEQAADEADEANEAKRVAKANPPPRAATRAGKKKKP